MFQHSYTTFSPTNLRLIRVLVVSHLFWGGAVMLLQSIAPYFASALPWWTFCFIAVQLFMAIQLVLPAHQLLPEERSRGFYLFWGGALALSTWALNQLSVQGHWESLLAVFKSGLLLLTATLVGAALARYVNRLWEIVPVCLVMTLADVLSWSVGPTEEFADSIRNYYLAPEGPPPAIDMVLVKLALPGSAQLVPVFGISDWIMVVFFALVAGRYRINDNLLGRSAVEGAPRGIWGRYLPVSVVALFAAIVLAQTSGLFVPALPLIAVAMLLWYGGRQLLLARD